MKDFIKKEFKAIIVYIVILISDILLLAVILSKSCGMQDPAIIPPVCSWESGSLLCGSNIDMYKSKYFGCTFSDVNLLGVNIGMFILLLLVIIPIGYMIYRSVNSKTKSNKSKTKIVK
jgi:hypothetical protein